jgi:hypothetical protein
VQSTNRQVDENPQKDWALPKEIEKRGVVKSCVDMSGRRRVGGGRSFGLSMAKNRQKNKNPSTFSLRGWLSALNPIQPSKGRCVYVIRHDIGHVISGIFWASVTRFALQNGERQYWEEWWSRLMDA